MQETILQAEAGGSFKLRVPSDDDEYQAMATKIVRDFRWNRNTLESRRDRRVE